jgi:hypothetical protein
MKEKERITILPYAVIAGRLEREILLRDDVVREIKLVIADVSGKTILRTYARTRSYKVARIVKKKMGIAGFCNYFFEMITKP